MKTITKADLSNLTKEDLITKYLDLAKDLKTKKYGLVWDRERERERVVVECETNFPLLEHIKEKDIAGDKNEIDNILIEGDNYHALMCLNYTHKEKIDVIYIDPPYNTGKPNQFSYNDKFVLAEDGYRHSKWLNFMEKRLRLAKNLLKQTGNIFISIDDYEQANLKILCDEIFGEDNFIKCLVWESGKPFGFKATKTTWPRTHEYILHYAKNKNVMNYFPTYSNEISSSGEKIMTASIIKAKENLIYSMDWIVGAKESVGFGSGQKPLALIQKLLDATIVKNQESIVLDFFAGSGTTAHAISEINKKKDGKINFIICTNNLQDEKIIDKFTLPRMKNNNIQISYYKTSLLPHNSKVNDDDRINLTDRVGELVGLKESTLETMEINSYYHILNNKSKTKCTLIYFNEDLYKWDEALDKVNADCKAYKFSYDPIDKMVITRNNHKIIVEDIPEPILRMYESLQQGEENV